MARAGMLSREAPRRLSFPPPSAGRSNYTKSEFYVIFSAGAPGGLLGGWSFAGICSGFGGVLGFGGAHFISAGKIA